MSGWIEVIECNEQSVNPDGVKEMSPITSIN